MHNYLSPKLCAVKMALPKASINIACFAQYNDFSPPQFDVFSKTAFEHSVLNDNRYSYNNEFNCKNIIKDTEIFKQADQSIHLQKSGTGLKKHLKDEYTVYLAAEGNHQTTNSTLQDAQTNAKNLNLTSNGYWHSNYTTHQQLHQQNCTLFFNRVLDHTGRLYIKTIKKNQSKKSNP